MYIAVIFKVRSFSDHELEEHESCPGRKEDRRQKPMLLHLVRLSNYRERKVKVTSEKEFAKKAMRAMKDNAKYVQRNIGILENKVKNLKYELRKSSKKRRKKF